MLDEYIESTSMSVRFMEELFDTTNSIVKPMRQNDCIDNNYHKRFNLPASALCNCPCVRT